MAQQTINIGTTANDGTGDPLRTAFDKVNSNFTELYNDESQGEVNSIIAGDGISVDTATGNVTVTNTITNNNQLTNGAGYVDGSGTANYVPKWTDGDTIGNSVIYDDGTNVSIGTASAVQKMHIDGGVSNAYLHFSNNDTGATISDGSDIGINESEDLIVWNRESTNLRFATNNSEKMRIDSNGNIGINAIPENSLGTWRNYQFGSLSMASRANDGIADAMFGTNFKFTTANAEQRISAYATSRVFFNDDIITFQNSGADSAGSNITWSERMRIDSSGDIFSGFGTVAGNFNFSNTNYRIEGGNSFGDLRISAPRLRYFHDGSTINLNIDNGLHQFYNSSGTESMRINSSGNVGIGTTNPTQKLTVQGNVNAFGGFEGYRLDGGVGLEVNGGDLGSGSYIAKFKDYSNNSKVVIDGTGNVGIGTSSPNTKFEVNQGGDNNGITLSNSVRGASRVEYQLSGVTNQAAQFVHNNGTDRLIMLSFQRDVFNIYTSGTERMRITSGGDVLIGTTLGNLGNYAGYDFSAVGKLMINSKDGNAALDLNQTFDDTITRGAIRFYRNEVLVGSITVSTTATAYNTSSDYRLKENVVPMTGALNRVDALKPSRFNFIADAETTVDGFLAHELAEVIPEAVTGEKDAVDENGNPQYQGIDQSKIVPLLTAALQEANQMIKDLTTRIETLENN